jgi:hypothetical protein
MATLLKQMENNIKTYIIANFKYQNFDELILSKQPGRAHFTLHLKPHTPIRRKYIITPKSTSLNRMQFSFKIWNGLSQISESITKVLQKILEVLKHIDLILNFQFKSLQA